MDGASPDGAPRFSIAHLLDATQSASEIAYEAAPDPGKLQKRLVEKVSGALDPDYDAAKFKADYQCMSVNPNLKMPAEMTMPLTLVGDTMVYIAASHGNRGHRVRAICNICGHDCAAGRLHQHRKVHIQ